MNKLMNDLAHFFEHNPDVQGIGVSRDPDMKNLDIVVTYEDRDREPESFEISYDSKD